MVCLKNNPFNLFVVDGLSVSLKTQDHFGPKQLCGVTMPTFMFIVFHAWPWPCWSMWSLCSAVLLCVERTRHCRSTRGFGPVRMNVIHPRLTRDTATRAKHTHMQTHKLPWHHWNWVEVFPKDKCTQTLKDKCSIDNNCTFIQQRFTVCDTSVCFP